MIQSDIQLNMYLGSLRELMDVLAVVSFLGVSLGVGSGIFMALWGSFCSPRQFLILWSVAAIWWKIEGSMWNLRAFFLHLLLKKCWMTYWMTASSRRPSPSPFHRRHCQTVGHDAACQDTRWCSVEGGELPLRDFHSLCPPKKFFPLWSLLSQVLWCWKSQQSKSEGILGCQHSAGELLMCSRGRRWF